MAILCLAVSDLTVIGQDSSERVEVRTYLSRAQHLLVTELKTFNAQVERPLPQRGRGEGFVLVATFGSRTASENDAELAVRAAMALVERLDQLNREILQWNHRLEIRVGIHYDRVPILSDGTVQTATDSLALARGLALAAPAEHILITSEVSALLADQFHYESMGDLYLEGVSQPLEALRVTSPNPREGRWQRSRLVRRSPMVGRDHQLQTLQEIYQQACDPQSWSWSEAEGRGFVRPLLVTIAGPEGSGKSRLLHEFRRVASPFREGKAVPLVGRASSIFPVPYAVFRELLRNLFGIRSSDSLQVRERKLEAGLKPYYQFEPQLLESFSVLRYLTGVEREEDGGGQSARIFSVLLQKAFVLLLRAVAARSYRPESGQGPLLLYLEDLNRLHARSWLVLEGVLEKLQSSAPVVIFATHPPSFNLPESIRRSTEVRSLTLSPLSQEAQRQLVRGILDSPGLPLELERRVLERAGGNPYYLEELILSLVEARVLVSRGGVWQMDRPAEDVELPPTLVALLQFRLDTLERPARELVARAAVAGPTVHPEVLDEVQAELAGPPAAPLLKRLEDARFLRPLDQEGEHLYVFESPLVREVAYQSLLPQNRTVLHALVARALERRYGATLAEHYLELANHLRAGGEPERAARYFALAGEKAQREYANELALSCYGSSLALEPDGAEARRVRWRQARVLRLQGKALEADAVLEKLAEELHPPLDETYAFVAEVFLELSRVRRNIGRLPDAIELAERALRLFRASGDFRGEADALVAVGKCQRLAGDLEGARGSYETALVLLKDGGNTLGRGKVLSNLGRLALDARDLDRARDLFEEALALQEATADRWGVALETGHLGEVAFAEGQLEAAQPYFRRCLREATELDIRPLVAGSRMYLGAIACGLGEVSGLEDLSVGIRIAEALKDLPRQVRGHQLLAWAYQRLGQVAEGQACRAQAEALAEEAGMPRGGDRLEV